MERDSAGHLFVDIDNIRITYIPAADRNTEADWAGSDVLRIQSYRGTETSALHRGGEFPVGSIDAFSQFIAALCRVYVEGRDASRA